MIVYVAPIDNERVSLIRFVAKGRFFSGFRTTYDIRTAYEFRTMDEAIEVIEKLSKNDEKNYYLTANRQDELNCYRYYAVSDMKKSFFSGMAGKLPILTRNIEEAILYQLSRLGALETISAISGKKRQFDTFRVYLNRVNPYYNKKYVITLESDKDSKDIKFYQGVEYDKPILCDNSDEAVALDVELAMLTYETLASGTRGYKISIMPKPECNINCKNLIDYLKLHPFDVRINVGGGTLKEYDRVRNKGKLGQG